MQEWSLIPKCFQPFLNFSDNLVFAICIFCNYWSTHMVVHKLYITANFLN